MSTYIPVDVVINILKRLAVQSLVRFRCVRKTWYSLIKTYDFIQAHLTHAKKCNDTCLVFKSTNGNRSLCILPNCETCEGIRISLGVPPDPRMDYWDIVGSRDGLLLLTNDGDHRGFWLWNPETRECLELPRIPGPQGYEYFDRVGMFFFDPFVKAYKIIMCRAHRFFPETRTMDSGEDENKGMYLYTLGVGSWRKIQATNGIDKKLRYRFNNTSLNEVVNGRIHGFGYKPRAIVGFDLKEENLEVIPLPNHKYVNEHMYKHDIGVLGGSLCMYFCFYDHADLWVMKDYGVSQSWTKQFTYTIPIGPNGAFRTFIAVGVNGEILYHHMDTEVISIKPKNGGCSHFRRHVVPPGKFHPYVSSLVSPNVDEGVLEQ